MLSFHNDKSIKEKYIKRLEAHYAADEIIQGIYWENGRGCAVGCTIHSSDHFSYEKELGIPIILARLEDKIFENLPIMIAKEWPLRFLNAIPVGKDLSKIWPKFAIWLLIDNKYGLINFTKNKDLIKNIAELYKKSLTEKVSVEKWHTIANQTADAVSTAADDAATMAAYAAAYAARTGAYVAANSGGTIAAYAAANYAGYVVTKAATATATAAYAAGSFAFACAAASAAAGAADCAAATCYKYKEQEITLIQADKLIELLKSI